MTKHTPGPWITGYMGRGKYPGSTGIYPDSGGPAFAILPPGRKDIQEANARLIKAAPELFEMLKFAQNYIPDSSYLHKTVEVLIAKIEG